MEGEKAKETDYIYKKSAISDKGNYYGFRCLNIGSYGCFDGLYIRNDLLEKWGLSIPETIDNWENVFKKAKDNGIKYPLTGKNWGVENEQRYKEAIKWCDYIYDDESMILKIFGIEGDTYIVEKYEDFLNKTSSI